MYQAELASETMKAGYNCAQSVIRAFANLAGLENETEAVKMAASLGGGVGRTGHICGALTGAALIIGRKYGSEDPSDAEAKERVYGITSRLLELFEKEHGSVECSDLLATDMKNPDEVRQAREKGLFRDRCPMFVLSSGRILEELLEAG